jgi:Tol biopolymer transport system component
MAFLLLWVTATLCAAERGNLLVDAYGKLLLIQPHGIEKTIADGANLAKLSPDGLHAAFTDSQRSLLVITLATGTVQTVVKLASGARFEEIGWTPDGKTLIYESTGPSGDALYMTPFPPEPGLVRRLGPWYQGFSISPDGSKVVHAVNYPETGLEVLDLATGRRELIHKTRSVAWGAKYSPDGQSIAYQITIDEPEHSGQEPTCTGPTLGLRIYSLADRRDIPVVVRDAPPEWKDVKNFDWSPDSTHIALTLGEAGCDYPGGAAAVFLTSTDMSSQARLSDADTALAFEPRFSPDGTGIAYVDFSDSPARLFLYDVASRTTTLIRRATAQDNYYRLHDWK